MDFRPTEEQELLMKSIRELLEKEAPESLMAELDEKHEFPWGPWKAMAKQGLLGLGIPEEYGGTPADIQTIIMACEEMGRIAYPVGVVFGLGVITIRDIVQFGSHEQKKAVLEGLQEGELPAALGISEPQAGSDAAALATSAVLEGDEWVINGQKIYCTLSSLTKYILLMTRDSQNPNPYKAMSMFLLPTDAPGVRINPLRKTGWWMIPTCEVFLDNVRLPKDALVGKLNNGWPQLMANFEIERLSLCAVNVGGAQAAFDDAATFANQRVQFGQPISKFQITQYKIAHMATKLENMRNLCYKVAWMMDNNLPVRHEAAMCKLYCAQAGFQVVDEAMQIMGGMGYMMDHRLQRLWRDIRVMRVGGGTDEVMVNIIGPQLLKKYSK